MTTVRPLLWRPLHSLGRTVQERWLSALWLFALVLGFAAPGLIRAQVPDPPDKRIEALVASVDALVASGKLKPLQGRVLAGTLDLATRSLEQGNTDAAVLLLKGFIAEVKLLVKLKRLSSGDGQPLIDAAEAIVALLTEPLPACPACVFGPKVYKRLLLALSDSAVFGADPAAEPGTGGSRRAAWPRRPAARQSPASAP